MSKIYSPVKNLHSRIRQGEQLLDSVGSGETQKDRRLVSASESFGRREVVENFRDVSAVEHPLQVFDHLRLQVAGSFAES